MSFAARHRNFYSCPLDHMDNLVRESWQIYNRSENRPFLVQPSIPILFFGDSNKYFSSMLKVITVGLNPSRIEFPQGNRFLRFSAARNIYPQVLEGRFYAEYLQALNGYFQKPPNNPYKPWFNSFEHLLRGLDCSYHGEALNTVLHTDLCSPLATDPTWRNLDRDSRQTLMGPGIKLWHRLVERLSPDLIVASIARSHLDQIAFPRLSDWTVVHTVERMNPYQVEFRRLGLPNGKSTVLVFGRAANTPFGTVSKRDKHRIGVTLKEFLHGK